MKAGVMKLTLSPLIALLGIFHAAFAQDVRTVTPTSSSTRESYVPSMSPTMTPVKPTLPPTGSAGCYDNLDDVMLVISDDSLLNTQKDIILCTNTVYDIGFREGSGIKYGQMPINPRSNLLVKCGEDGNSANNCILRGGSFAIFQIPTFFSTDPVATNVVFQGLTIEGQAEFGIFYSKTGDVSFIDCIIQNNKAVSPVMIPYTNARVTRRLEEQLRADGIFGWEAADVYLEHLKDVEDAIQNNDQKFLSGEYGENPFSARELERHVQEVDELDLTFVGNKFIDNIQVSEEQRAVVTIFSGATNLVMEDCEFTGNMFGNPDKSPVGYALLTGHNVAVALKNICMSGNDFHGEGAFVLENPFDFTAKGIYVDGGDDVTCPFAALAVDNIVECVEADLATCAIGESEVPSSSIRINNGGFERENNKWKEISGNPIRECGVNSEYTGDCAYAFYGESGIESRIKSKAKRVEGGSVGDVFTLTFYANGVDLPTKNAFKASVKIKGSEPTKVYSCKSSRRGTFQYTKMSCSFTIDRDFEKMFIQFSYRASTGALNLDRIGLEVRHAASH